MIDLKDKIVLVTGATSGIGEATARAFAAAGANVMLTGRRVERLKALKEELLEKTDVRLLAFDVSSSEQVEAALKALKGKWTKVDILVNNAGLALGQERVQDAKISDWEAMIDTNLKGVLYMTRHLLPGMIERGYGHIINLGSISGEEVYPGGAVYCATKHAVRALTQGFAMDTVGMGVRFSSVDPGLVETEFSDVRFAGDKARVEQVYRGITPLTPAEVASTIVYTASQPENVNIQAMRVVPSAQASALIVNREIPFGRK